MHLGYVYTACLIGSLPFFLLRLWWKGFKTPAYRQRILERFAFDLVGSEPVDLWVHAVSLGEVNASIPLIEQLLSKGYRVLLTSMTPTGSNRVMQAFGGRVLHHYLPYDLPWAVKRFLRYYQPRIGVILETELWPNVIWYAKKSQVPLVLVNGRLSAQSYARYQWGKGWMQQLLNQFDVLLVQTADDQKRFLMLGARPEKVCVMGNMKFDVSVPKEGMGRFAALKQAWGSSRMVLMLASTHEPEEKQILMHLPILQAAIPHPLILIAPRHQERFDVVFQVGRSLGLQVAKASQPESINDAVEVVILDALGELMQAYQCADVAWVGGSFAPIGGHNMLEPIAVGVPVLSGPQVHHFQWISERLVEAGALQVVATPQALMEAVIALQTHPAQKNKQVSAATNVLLQHRGATMRYVAQLINRLGSGAL